MSGHSIRFFPRREHDHWDSSSLHVSLLYQCSTREQNVDIVRAVAVTLELARKHTESVT